jgi:hypothetical protein
MVNLAPIVEVVPIHFVPCFTERMARVYPDEKLVLFAGRMERSPNLTNVLSTL